MEFIVMIIAIGLLISAALHSSIGLLFWFTYFGLVYFFTFPGGPIKQILNRQRERRQAGNTACGHCGATINAMDTLCVACKLEMSFGKL
ncbi:hypothetical protein [Reinekea sp. G2M2-21]|uniref:hypothetical protein n=1 Tax=Reinekea sp. G2M2-21 TaxID=2788942 RepID=UPI0018A9DDF7|nr:hypothetical protein [Reinekea sp. G2M2-21]